MSTEEATVEPGAWYSAHQDTLFVTCDLRRVRKYEGHLPIDAVYLAPWHVVERAENPPLSSLRKDLARALPVVEAAGAVVECDQAKPALGKSISVWRAERRRLLDALARAVRAAREPRTGEG